MPHKVGGLLGEQRGFFLLEVSPALRVSVCWSWPHAPDLRQGGRRFISVFYFIGGMNVVLIRVNKALNNGTETIISEAVSTATNSMKCENKNLFGAYNGTGVLGV